MTETNSVEIQIHTKMLELYRIIGERTKVFGNNQRGYWPSRYLTMVKTRGGVGAAKELIRKYPCRDQLSPALQHMVDHGKPELARELAVEALVVQAPFNQLFDVTEILIATRKLDYLQDLVTKRRA